ncbi:MAG TPA: hypothetical protein VF855_04810, partial [Acidimicrobiales bacterium]
MTVGYLGYDPSALPRLARVLDDVLQQSARLARTVDGLPEACHAHSALQGAATLLAPWPERLAAIVRCAPGALVAPVSAPTTAAFAAIARPGWLAVTDEARDVYLDPELAAPQLARWMADRSAQEIASDPTTVSSLRELAASIGGAEALLAHLGPTRLGALLEALATEVTHHGGSRQGRALAVLDALGAVVGKAWPHLGLVAPWESVLVGAHPVAAATVIAAAALPADDLARLALPVWQSAASSPVSVWWHVPRPTTVLAGVLAGSPAAAVAVVGSWSSEEMHLLLDPGSVDPRALRPMLAAAFSVDAGDAGAVGPAVTRVLLAVHRHEVWVDSDLVRSVSEAVAPWIDAVALGAPLGRAGSGWDWDGVEPVDVLRTLSSTTDGRRALARAGSDLFDASVPALSAVATGNRVVDDLGLAVGRLSGVLGAAAVAAARRAASQWSSVWEAAGSFAGSLLPGGRVTRAVTGYATAALARLVQRVWESAQLPGTPSRPPGIYEVMAEETTTELTRAGALLHARAAAAGA